MSKPSITVTPKKFWDLNISFSFKALFKTAVSVVATAYNPLSLGVAFKEAAEIITVEDRPAWKAYDLIYLSLEKALRELVLEGKNDIRRVLQVESDSTGLELKYDPDQFEKLIDALDMEFGAESIEIDNRFLKQPDQLGILVPVREQFEAWLEGLGVSEIQRVYLGGRIGTYFASQVFSALRKDRVYYLELIEYLEVSREEGLLWQKEAYRQEMLQEWMRPVFGESFGLEAIYVSLRASLNYRDASGEKYLVAYAEAYIWKWLKEDRVQQPMLILKGGPGSGKSSLMKRILYRSVLANKYPVYFISLQYFGLKENLEDEVRRYLLQKYGYEVDPFHRDAPSALFIFDGLDELRHLGQGAQSAAKEFVQSLVQLVRMSESAQGRQSRFLLTGRDLVIEQTNSLAGNRAQVLELLPYNIGDQQELHSLSGPDEEFYDLVVKDQRELWWLQYWKAIGSQEKAMPKALEQYEFEVLTSQPLLNYLLALGLKKGLVLGENDNVNSVYQHLINSVRMPEWREPDMVLPEEEEFFRYLEEVGIAAWHDGDVRITTYGRIEERCEGDQDLQDLIKRIDPKEGHMRLLTAFYFRGTEDIGGDKAFEFTHKSFGEYLVARRIVLEAEEIVKSLNSRRGRKWREPKQGWLDLAGPTSLTSNIWAFLKREIDIQVEEAELVTWYESLSELFRELLTSGFNPQGFDSHIEMSAQSRNAIETLWLMVSALSWRFPKDFVREPEWPEGYEARDLIEYFNLRSGSTLFRKGFSGIKFPSKVHLNRVSLMGANLNETILFEAFLEGIDLENCNLFRANLSGAMLSGADLVGSDFGAANLLRTDFSFSRLLGASFSKAVLVRGNLFGSDLRGTAFFNTNLHQANLSNAIFNTAFLKEANLTKANLQGALLQDADFQGSYLSGAIFQGAWFNRNTNLEDCSGWRKAKWGMIYYHGIPVHPPELESVLTYLAKESEEEPDLASLEKIAKEQHGWVDCRKELQDFDNEPEPFDLIDEEE